MTDKEKWDRIDYLSNKGFDLEVEFRVFGKYTPEEWRKLNDEITAEINRLTLEIVGPENMDKKKCVCGLSHITESWWDSKQAQELAK
jgi:hypothetical protein